MLGYIYEVILTLSSLLEEHGESQVFFIFKIFKIFMNFNYKDIYICIRVLILLKCQNADIGPVLPTGHPRMYVRPVLGEDHGLIRVLEGKLARITQRVPTLRIEHIPAAMQKLVVGIPPVWIHLMRQVARAVLVYIDVVEAVVAEEAEEA